ncbi:hypothetical protein SMITH_481 [Smithella sp. ME-1]|nr:hypothetical protein SMITH_481 [Smithella sp. ME-1]
MDPLMTIEESANDIPLIIARATTANTVFLKIFNIKLSS